MRKFFSPSRFLILINPPKAGVSLFLFLNFFINLNSIAQVGTWTALTNLSPHSSGGGMLLLSDGTVLAKSSSGGTDGYGNTYDKLTPDIHGSYISGTWTSIAPMHNTRLYYSSQILMDGRVYVAGGEYGTGKTLGETYNPLTDAWTDCPNPSATFSDANSEILPDGRVLQALVQGSLTGTDIYNPVSNTYISGPTATGIHNESAWVKLPDNSILYVNRLSFSSERYIPAQNAWISDANVPDSLYDPFGDETGGGLLLPDGRAFFIGATGHTAYYTPSGSTANGTWVAGPDIPGGHGTPDAPIAMMVNGKILCAVSPIPTSANHFPTPTTFYEFDYITNTFTSINAPGGGSSVNTGCYVTNFLDLPDGRVLYCRQGTTQYYVYTPSGSQLAAGKPVIGNITSTACTTFTITGTGFNGISEGASYGDDWQMASNYPLVRLTSGANAYYARTFNWNSTGVKRGAAADTAKFTLPAGLPAGTYSLVVVANGISSDPTTFITSTTATASSNSPVCAGTNLTLSSTGGVSYLWSGPNSFTSTQQNPAVSNVSSAAAGTYTVTVTNTGGCTATASTTASINAQPTVATGTNSPVCSGSSLNLSSSGGTLYSWSGPNAFSSTVQNPVLANSTIAATGTYTVTVTGSNGCTTRATITATVNQRPTALCGSNSPVCAGNSLNLTSSGGATYAWSGPNSFSSSLQNTTISNPNVAATGTYTVTVTSNGCSSSSSTPVIVNALPSSSSGSNSPVCSGNTLNLTSGGGATYSWSGPNSFSSTLQNPSLNNVSIAAGGTYTVTVTGNGCSSASTTTVTINSAPTPTAGSNSPICSGSALNLTSAGGTTYSWAGPNSFFSTQQNPSISNAALAASGTYTVTVTNSNNCMAIATTVAIVNNCTASLTIKAFLEGYYITSSLMRSTLYQLGLNSDPTVTDSITVNFWATDHLTNPNPDYTVKALLHNNGMATLIYPGGVSGTSCYIAVIHRNSLETWSRNPIAFINSISYDFTTALTQAYENGFNPPMKNMGNNIFAFFGGNANGDHAIDAADMAAVDNDVQSFLFGYNRSDCNGNGSTDALDMSIIDNNAQLQLFYARP